LCSAENKSRRFCRPPSSARLIVNLAALAVQREPYSVVRSKGYLICQYRAMAAADVRSPSTGERLSAEKRPNFYTRRRARLARSKSSTSNRQGLPTEWIAFPLHCQRGRVDDEPGAGRGRQNLRDLFSARAQAFREYQIVRPPTFQFGSICLARALLSGGLLESWLLQKCHRKEPWGSALWGFIVQPGKNLILWDEIKEVRPLRVLNIRSPG